MSTAADRRISPLLAFESIRVEVLEIAVVLGAVAARGSVTKTEMLRFHVSLRRILETERLCREEVP
ncbi:hypothetical protein [Paraburkholderia metrosideri]|uniref:Uncharacterized protein n=1 Tax=Paraburkholderia metrosideri TaxID=580937 RepID=A0ABM8P1J7_9BURK|nr:hypothetical protein [Paraburkholderia metrosideri]CAD6553488.1 hypothetical protein LMG28140_05302 [Paraburkholderia metrosideri]